MIDIELHETLNQVCEAIELEDYKTAQRLIESREKKYGGNPYFLWQKGIYEQRIGSHKRIVVLPLFEKAYNCGFEELGFLKAYGSLLLELRIYATAVTVLGKIIQLKHDDVETYIELAKAFSQTGNSITAINTLKLAANINPNHSLIPTVYCLTATALMECGYQTESLELFKKALEIDNKNITFAANYLFCLNYSNISREGYYLLCKKYGTLWKKNILYERPPFPQTEKIKIGFISGDFCYHAVSFFISSIFENFDKNKFEIYLFSTLAIEKYDYVTKMFIEQTGKWYDISKNGHISAAELIRKNEITVLYDLSGYTNGGAPLEIFGFRPAPVQVSYCGYPNTTGLKCIDFRITDNICEPADAQNFHSEKLFKIDGCFLCYQPRFELIPECTFENPYGRSIIFGSFNNFSKITTKTIKLWCEVLMAVPNSKLAIKYKHVNDLKFREVIIARFAENGLSADRIIIFNFDFDPKEHFAQYNKIDIALDTFPYNGTTTTCEALYMGVPVITILGDRHCSRVSASLLNAVGLRELAADDKEGFIRIAADLATNTQKLAELKQNLRERMRSSSLMDKKSFTQKWQNAILDMINEIKHEK